MTQGSPSGAVALSAPRFRPADAGRAPRSWTFGDFRLDEGERRLLRRGATVPLTPKAFDLLVALLEKGGRLVRKHELMERLWPSLFVGEGTLARHISSLRKALSDDSSRTPLIQTVHKSGYRFLGQAKEASEREAPDAVACATCAARST
jgi:DNA-binding winged helix-turn-helix (wHTH) protein